MCVKNYLMNFWAWKHEWRVSAYQSVTTFGVIGRSGTPYILARPKSAEMTDALKSIARQVINNTRYNL